MYYAHKEIRDFQFEVRDKSVSEIRECASIVAAE